MDVRLRNIENTIAAANPQSLGPRLNVVEQWQAVAADRYSDTRADVNSLQSEVAVLKEWKNQMTGVIRALGVVATISGILSGVLAVVSFMR
jgi:hypothetical protein